MPNLEDQIEECHRSASTAMDSLGRMLVSVGDVDVEEPVGVIRANVKAMLKAVEDLASSETDTGFALEFAIEKLTHWIDACAADSYPMLNDLSRSAQEALAKIENSGHDGIGSSESDATPMAPLAPPPPGAFGS